MADHQSGPGGSKRSVRPDDRPAPGDLAIDRPDTVAEVTDCFNAYDEALLANDLAALDRWFWDPPRPSGTGSVRSCTVTTPSRGIGGISPVA